MSCPGTVDLSLKRPSSSPLAVSQIPKKKVSKLSANANTNSNKTAVVNYLRSVVSGCALIMSYWDYYLRSFLSGCALVELVHFHVMGAPAYLEDHMGLIYPLLVLIVVLEVFIDGHQFYSKSVSKPAVAKIEKAEKKNGGFVADGKFAGNEKA